MNRQDIERYKLEFEQRPDTWKSYGADLVDAGSPNPCDKSPIARKVLCGRWQEAYQDWLKTGDFSRDSEELLLAFILATEFIFHRRAPAPVPADLPKRVWDEAEFQKRLCSLQDVDRWNLFLGRFQKTGTGDFYVRRNGFAKLLSENKPEAAEAFYREREMDQDSEAELKLAMARTCANAHGAKEEAERADATMWYYADRQGQRSEIPISETELKRVFENGTLLRSTLVWKEGMTQWQQATFLKAFQTRVYAGALPPALPGAQL
jgi:hypothetical protein